MQDLQTPATTIVFCGKHQERDCTCGEAETFTFVATVNVNGRGFEASYGSFRDTVVTSCPSCGGAGCERDAEFATGERLLSGYQPRPGEIVQNHWSHCRTCGWNQAS